MNGLGSSGLTDTNPFPFSLLCFWFLCSVFLCWFFLLLCDAWGCPSSEYFSLAEATLKEMQRGAEQETLNPECLGKIWKKKQIVGVFSIRKQKHKAKLKGYKELVRALLTLSDISTICSLDLSLNKKQTDPAERKHNWETVENHKKETMLFPTCPKASGNAKDGKDFPKRGRSMFSPSLTPPPPGKTFRTH